MDTGLRPANYIRDVKDKYRFLDYPKLNELIDRKNQLLRIRNPPAMHIKADLKEFDLSQMGQFDVILMDPPWKEYEKRIANIENYIDKDNFKSWTLQEIAQIPLEKISSTPTFLFLWCGCEK